MPRPNDTRPEGSRSNDDCLHSFLASLDAFEVADAACGGGEFTELLIEHLSGFHRLVGFDPEKESLDEARFLIDDRRVHFKLASIEEVALPERQFDLVSISNALHHIEHPRAALKRLYELVHAHGFLLIHEMIADGLSMAERNYRDFHHLKAAVDRLRGVIHNPTFTRDALRRLLLESLSVARPAEIALDCVVFSRPETDESVWARLAFIEEYVSRVTDRGAREKFEAEVGELRSRVLVDGFQTPPRAVIALGRSPEPSG